MNKLPTESRAERAIAIENPRFETILDRWVGDADHESAAVGILHALPKSIRFALRTFVRIGWAPPPGFTVESWHVVDESVGDDDGFEPDGDIEGEVELVATVPRPIVVEPFDEDSIELAITAQAFEPDYTGWTIQFTAIGAPRLKHQNTDPSLEAFVKLVTTPTTHQLTGGAPEGEAEVVEGGTALVRGADAEDTRAEAAYLKGALGAQMVEVERYTEIPTALPSDAEVLEAMQRSLAQHLAKVRDERQRLAVTEGAEEIVGKRFKVSKKES